MRLHENRMFDGVPKTRNDWFEARRTQGLDNVQIRTTVKCLVGIDPQPHVHHRTPEFYNFQTYIAVTYCHILYKTGNEDTAVHLMQQIFPKTPSKATLTRYRQLVAKLVRWMVLRCIQPSKYPVFEAIFHAAISVPNLVKIREAVLDGIFATVPQPNLGVQSHCLIPLYIPFLVHSRVVPMSFEKMCELLEIPHLQTEYHAWRQWLATDEILNTPRQLSLGAMQSYESDNEMSYTSLQSVNKPMENSFAHEMKNKKQTTDIPYIAIDLGGDRMRERPKDIDSFLGDIINLELFAANLLQPLEHFIAAPLSALSILNSQFAFLDSCSKETETRVEQYDWLQSHENLADQVCEDVIENGIMCRIDLYRLSVAIHREANDRAGTNTPSGWIQIVAQITTEPRSCEVTLHKSHDNGQVSLIGPVTWKASEALIFDERVSFTPNVAIDYIAMAFPKP